MKIKTAKRDGLKFSFVNEEEFECLYKNIFILKEYNYQTQNPVPFILDCGSHIGMATLYFKKQNPDAQVIAFEPNPITFRLLEQNIHQNNFSNVFLVNAAVGPWAGKINFYISKDEETPWTWCDSAVINKCFSEKTVKTTKVPSVRLSLYIRQNVDLLKIDIEGLEYQVLKEVDSKISKIKEIFMEYHGSSTKPTNNLEKILSLLRKHQFSYTITQEGKIINDSDAQKKDLHWIIIHAICKQ